MSSYDIRLKARQVLKKLPGKYSLFTVPILLALFLGGLQAYIRIQYRMTQAAGEMPSTNLISSPFPWLIQVLLTLFSLAASYTMLEVIRGKRQTVQLQHLTRTFSGTYLLNLFLLYIVKRLLLLPWLLLAGVPLGLAFIYLLTDGTVSDPGVAIAILIGLIGFVMLIIKGLAYNQAEMILFDRIENGQDLDPFDIIKESKTLMTGKKLDFVILQLSFLGWYLLVPFTIGILEFYIFPYHLTANTVFYDQLKHSQTD